MEGKARERNVVVEYKDHTTALVCYRSSLRQRYADSDFIAIKGAEAT